MRNRSKDFRGDPSIAGALLSVGLTVLTLDQVRKNPTAGNLLRASFAVVTTLPALTMLARRRSLRT
jgi:hypothetical protein